MKENLSTLNIALQESELTTKIKSRHRTLYPDVIPTQGKLVSTSV